MKIDPLQSNCRQKAARGYTLIEMLMSIGVGAVLLLNMDILYVYGLKSFVCIANYEILDSSSCNTLDSLSKTIRGSTGVVSYQPGQSITFTNSLTGKGVTITFDPNTETLVSKVTGETAKTNLTGCDSWSFSLYTRYPEITAGKISFYAANNASSCKLVQMNWHCARKVLGSKLTTESVQTAQIVLRNKTN